MATWKARIWLRVCSNETFFDIAHGCRAMTRSVCNARASNGGRSLCIQISSRERSYPLPTYWHHLNGNWLRYNFAADSFTVHHNARIASTVLATAFEMALCNRPYVTWLDGKGGPVNLQKGHSKQYISLTTDVLLLIVFTYVIPQAQLVHICLALIFITALFSNWSFLQYFPKKLITVKFNSWISFQWLCHFYGIKKIYSMHFKSRHC